MFNLTRFFLFFNSKSTKTEFHDKCQNGVYLMWPAGLEKNIQNLGTQKSCVSVKGLRQIDIL